MLRIRRIWGLGIVLDVVVGRLNRLGDANISHRCFLQFMLEASEA